MGWGFQSMSRPVASTPPPPKKVKRMRQWVQISCAHCDTENLVDNGDVEDLTVDDISGFKCHACQGNNVFDDEGESQQTDEEQLDDGKPVPE